MRSSTLHLKLKNRRAKRNCSYFFPERPSCPEEEIVSRELLLNVNGAERSGNPLGYLYGSPDPGHLPSLGQEGADPGTSWKRHLNPVEFSPEFLNTSPLDSFWLDKPLLCRAVLCIRGGLAASLDSTHFRKPGSVSRHCSMSPGGGGKTAPAGEPLAELRGTGGRV